MQDCECVAAAKAVCDEALEAIGDFEGGRPGWEQVLAATYQPTELRLEALDLESEIEGVPVRARAPETRAKNR